MSIFRYAVYFTEQTSSQKSLSKNDSYQKLYVILCCSFSPTD